MLGFSSIHWQTPAPLRAEGRLDAAPRQGEGGLKAALHEVRGVEERLSPGERRPKAAPHQAEGRPKAALHQARAQSMQKCVTVSKNSLAHWPPGRTSEGLWPLAPVKTNGVFKWGRRQRRIS